VSSSTKRKKWKQTSKQTFSEHLQTKDMEMKEAKLLKLL
jgi:hypothetical protein